MMDDLRPVLADILDGLAEARPYPSALGGRLRLRRGADLLRWTHEFETTPSGDEVAELEHLRDLVEGIEDVLDEGGKIHPANRLKRVADIVRAGQ